MTAYELLRSLVGSEMCISDRQTSEPSYSIKNIETFYMTKRQSEVKTASASIVYYCLLYTSDAADDLLCVDLGGSRIIKKKKKKKECQILIVYITYLHYFTLLAIQLLN